MIAIGLLFILCGIGIVAIIYHKQMTAIYRDIADEEAEKLANQYYRHMLKTARVKVIQRLEIIDEMK